jgi:mitogen-activated protein kinase kinase
MNLDESLSAMSLQDAKDNKPSPIPTPRVMPPRPMPQRSPGRSVLPPMSRPGGSPLPPMSAGSPGVAGGLRGRPGAGRMGRPALNLSQLGLNTKQEQTPFANFSKYV